MATSGTIGQTTIDVTTIIEHAVRRCGVVASIISAEQQTSARENLFLILSNLATRGLSLWCVAQFTFGLTPGKAAYELPVGTVDVLDMLLRQGTYTDATTVGAGVANLSAASEIAVTAALVTPADAGSYSLVLESSPDGVAWTEVGTAVATYGTDPIGVDANIVSSELFFRVRDATDPTRSFTAAQFVSDPNELEMSKLARDDYVLLPNKTFSSQQPLQYWYDKQYYQPRVHIWPLPTESQQVSVYVQNQIQDPGAFTDTLQVPQRWLDAVISLLAPRVCLELPKELVPPDRYDKLVVIAAQTLRDAEDSETDGAPIRLAPNISPYTA